jgi:hypothetical protein
MQTPANMPMHISSAACRPALAPGTTSFPCDRDVWSLVGAVCVRVPVVRRLLGIRRYQIGGQNNHPPLVELTPCLICKSFRFLEHATHRLRRDPASPRWWRLRPISALLHTARFGGHAICKFATHRHLRVRPVLVVDRDGMVGPRRVRIASGLRDPLPQ